MSNDPSKTTVLLMEDHPISLDLYQRLLDKTHRVIIADLVNHALDWCRQGPVHCFVADYRLSPGVSGIEALYLAHKIDSRIGLLLVSGSPPDHFETGDFTLFDEMASDGRLHFLLKPFTAQAFVAAVNAALCGLPNDSTKAAADRARGYCRP